MNILFIGDIFGKTGRKMIETYLPKIVEKYSVECVIANGENTSHGKGLLQKHYDELLSHGISLITMGNHTYSKKEIFEYIDEADKLIVPLNKPKAMPGVGSRVIEIKGKKIRVTNLLGLTFMDGKPQNPFMVKRQVKRLLLAIMSMDVSAQCLVHIPMFLQEMKRSFQMELLFSVMSV